MAIWAYVVFFRLRMLYRYLSPLGVGFFVALYIMYLYGRLSGGSAFDGCIEELVGRRQGESYTLLESTILIKAYKLSALKLTLNPTTLILSPKP